MLFMFYFRRRSRESLQSSRAYNEPNGSMCGDYHLGLHCPSDHHHHHLHHQPLPSAGLLLPSKMSMSASVTGYPPMVVGGSLISPSGCSTGQFDSGSGDHMPQMSAMMPGAPSSPHVPGCNSRQPPLTSSSTENDYFRTWQLQRHAASRSAPFPGNRSSSSTARCPPTSVGGLLFDSCSTQSQPLPSDSRSPPEHIYESPKFERKNFLPPLSTPQQADSCGLQNQCSFCAALSTEAPFTGHNRCSSQGCSGGDTIHYYDLDGDEAAPRL